MNFMLFRRLRYSLDWQIKVKKYPVTSGGSRSRFLIKLQFPLNIKPKTNYYKLRYNSGRSRSGKVICFTKSSRLRRLSSPVINYRTNFILLGFVASLIWIPFQKKFISLIFFSSGIFFFHLTTYKYKLFFFIKSQPFYTMYINSNLIHFTRKYFFQQNLILNNIINPIVFIMFLPRAKPISLLELFPGRGVQYVRSSGSKGLIKKMNTKTGYGSIKLPSGVTKIFSIYGVGCEGKVFFPEKRLIGSTKFGDYAQYGKKPKTRGVAKNPVDHPHGGRTKAIKNPRTPWGKITKIK